MKEKLNCAMDIGEEMLISGAEIHRVEDSMNRILTSLGAKRVDTFIITSSMVVSVYDADGEVFTQTRRIINSGTDFERLHRLNALSRRICSGDVTSEMIPEELERISKTKTYPLWLEFLCYSLIAGAFTLFFGGTVWQAAVSFAVGAIARLILLLSDKTVKNKVFSKFAASFAVTALSYITVVLGLPEGADAVIIGNIMPLIPGIGLTNALRDIFTGDSITGVLRCIEALLIAVAIAAGYFVFVLLSGGVAI